MKNILKGLSALLASVGASLIMASERVRPSEGGPRPKPPAKR